MQTRSEPRRALSNFERAKEIYEGLPRAVETALGIAHCVSNVAESKRLLSDDHAAIVLFQKALDGYAQAETLAPNGHNDKITRGKAFCHQRLGALAQGNMEYDEARARFDKALTFFTEIGDLIGQASCRKGIGDLEMLSNHDKAVNYYNESLHLFEEAQFARGAADCIYSLGDLSFSRCNFEQAAAMYQRAQKKYEKVDCDHGKANCIYSITDVRLLREAADSVVYEQLSSDYCKAKTIFENNNDYIGIANCLQGISDILVLQGDTEGAARIREGSAILVHREFENRRESPRDLLWAKPSGSFSGRWRK